MRSGNKPNVDLEFYFQPGDDNPDMGSYSIQQQGRRRSLQPGECSQSIQGWGRP